MTPNPRCCPSCGQYAYDWCALTDGCGVETCANCDHHAHEEDDCRPMCPECGEPFDDGLHVDIGAVTTCYGVSPAAAA